MFKILLGFAQMRTYQFEFNGELCDIVAYDIVQALRLYLGDYAEIEISVCAANSLSCWIGEQNFTVRDITEYAK